MGVTETANALMWRVLEESWNNIQFFLGKDRHRIRAVRQALEGRAAPVYLEIGVSRGFVFRHIAADEKVAVDPAFQLSARSRRLAAAQARATHYCEMTSDAFFANETALLERRAIDVALIDGLHTYEQVVRDVENTLRYLRDDGVIVLHDCNPKSASAGCPATSYADFRAQNHWWEGLWCGDVWKAIVHLRSTRPDLRIAVLDCDFGVGIIRKGSPERPLSYSAEQVAALNYADLAADRERLLNLKPPAYLDEFLGSSSVI
ncbi:biotin carboxyl carrier protein [Mycobacterium haemophilum DSM 44634]|uniref:Biotin carboxyl carrier protein n=2 Tax=Mycobacterium haemophilum TaxID=29311 RepID=A0A0I9V298_9MYCO|nr:class I SAM-dependent methyltransferase [Mycobacterium haemophilum]AKN15801.1 biotin carboxyl carrier protein [Mycobacterium haemophilum DSM 44634]KLO36164.1 biotin carboxyl carrier protein [Mycobacterium haemophilum]KLO49924.1 biotin carboxyl carrier protein [Mycobacterium haemophilum]